MDDDALNSGSNRLPRGYARPGRDAARALLLMLSCGGAAAPALAAEDIDVVISDAGQRDADGSVLVDLRLLNDADAPAEMPLPDRVQAVLSQDGADRRVWLERDQGIQAGATIPASGFISVRYRLRAKDSVKIDGAALSIPALSRQKLLVTDRPFTIGTATRPGPNLDIAGAAPDRPVAAAPPADRSVSNRFLGNFSAYQPVYAVYGPGTNSEARLQISFKYRLFGAEQQAGPGTAAGGLYFAYTQRMFWDLGAESSPFRNIDFQPELFYLSPSKTLANGTSFSAQAGLSHESNGRDGTASRSVNSIYVAPAAAFPLGRGFRLSVAPRFAFFIGDLSDNPDIRRYRGNSGLAVELGKDDGLRLSTFTRFNFGERKGAFSADVSYSLPRIFEQLPSMYLFGQSFIGYGENLLDYDRRVTRVRVGVALVR